MLSIEKHLLQQLYLKKVGGLIFKAGPIFDTYIICFTGIGKIILVAASLSLLLLHMQGVRHFFEFLLKHHGPISG